MQKDLVSKEYMKDRRRFADLFNNVVFKGERVIDPDSLSPVDPTSQYPGYQRHRKGWRKSSNKGSVKASPKGSNKDLAQYFRMKEKIRDILKSGIAMQSDESAYLLFGVENQTNNSFIQPVMCSMYDVLEYAKQVDDIRAGNMVKWREEGYPKDEPFDYLNGFKLSDKLKPVITLVVYWGADDWIGPRKLSDMFADVPVESKKYIADYEINLVEPRKIKDFSKFHTGLGSVLKAFSVGGSKEAVSRLVAENPEMYKSLSVDDALMLSTFTEVDIKPETGKETVDMLKGWKDWTDEKIEIGRKEGRDERNMEVAADMLKEGASISFISKITKMPEDVIQKLAFTMGIMI